MNLKEILQKIDISSVKVLDDGDMEIISNTGFSEIQSITIFPVEYAFIANDFGEFSVIIKRAVPECFQDSFDEYLVFTD